MSAERERDPAVLEARRRDPEYQLEQLRIDLQTAIEIEHTTLPPYLTATFSLPEAENRQAQQIVRGVAMQEMLHMTLAANVLNAIGGRPELDHRSVVPGYPTNLPWHAPGFSVGLERFSRDQIAVFREIERPEYEPETKRRLDALAGAFALTPAPARESVPEHAPHVHGYHTIGEFYAAVMERLLWVVAHLGPEKVFTGERSRQVSPEHYYGGCGEVIVVTDLPSAMRALQTIVRQGEGTPESVWNGDHETATPREPAHFYSFDELLQGRLYKVGDAPGAPTGAPLPIAWDAAFPMRANPKRWEYEAYPEIFASMEAFDRTYFALLKSLEQAYTGHPSALRGAVAQMYELRYRAVDLLRTPDPKNPGLTLGPSWGSLPGGHRPRLAGW
jgi:hypothetical protein